MKAGGENVDLAPQILDIEGFIARVEPFFKESGFYEKEIARRTEQFGNIAHVWSIYESRHDPDDAKPFIVANAELTSQIDCKMQSKYS